MKKSIFLLAIFNIGIDTRELAKRVRIDYINISYVDPYYMKINLQIKKLDRKTNSANVTIDVLQDITNVRGRCVVYKFVDNVYKGTAMRYSGDMCQLMDIIQMKYDIDTNKKFDHLFKKCPVKKGHYYIYNFNGDDFGVAIFPTWKTKLEIQVEVNGKLIGSTDIFTTVVEE